MNYHHRPALTPFRGPTPIWQPKRNALLTNALVFIGSIACWLAALGFMIALAALAHTH